MNDSNQTEEHYYKDFMETAENETELRAILKRGFEETKNTDYPVDVFVYNEKGEDISESQFISEMISDIMNEDF